MSSRNVWFNPVKEANHNIAYLEREGQRGPANIHTGPSANFEKQWLSGKGYNYEAQSKYVGTPVENPNRNKWGPNEPNVPRYIPPAQGRYPTWFRKHIVAGLTANSPPLNVPPTHQVGYHVPPQVMPYYIPKATNEAPIPKPRAAARAASAERAEANQLLRNVNTIRMTQTSRRRKRSTRKRTRRNR